MKKPLNWQCLSCGKTGTVQVGTGYLATAMQRIEMQHDDSVELDVCCHLPFETVVVTSMGTDLFTLCIGKPFSLSDERLYVRHVANT